MACNNNHPRDTLSQTEASGIGWSGNDSLLSLLSRANERSGLHGFNSWERLQVRPTEQESRFSRRERRMKIAQILDDALHILDESEGNSDSSMESRFDSEYVPRSQ